MYDQLSSLDTSRTNWRIKVRVTCMWASASSGSEGKDGLKGFNLILLDDDNCHVQAFVYAENWKSFSSIIAEGDVFIISNFYTKQSMGTLRPTSSKVIINFSASTHVQKVDADDFMIPTHKFELVDLSELFSVVNKYENPDNPEFSTDIMGVVEGFEQLSKITTMFGERDIVKFRITDGRYSHKVSVWGKLAVSTDKAFANLDKSEPIIAVVTSCKMKIFRSSVQISTLPSSKIYLNLDTDCVDAMRSRLAEEGYKIQDIVEPTPIPVDVAPILETITLKDLGEKTNTDELKNLYLCNVNISNVEVNESWWYNSCNYCEMEVIKLEGKYKCNKCPRNIPVPQKRFNIVVLAEDDTEAFNFILKDRAARRAVGMTATKLISDSIKEGGTSGYPTKIKALCGKNFTFKIQINNDNVLLSSKIFEVTDAFAKFLPSTSSSDASMPDFSSTSYSEFSNNTVDLTTSGETPGSAKSTTKKIKMKE